jgi:proteasome accessory factor B
VQGAVRPDGAAGSFEVPPGTDLRALTRALAPAPADRTADVLVRRGTGHGLRRHAELVAVTPDRPEPAGALGVPDGWERLSVRYAASEALADELLGYGADVVVLAPEEVRRSVLARLREAAAVPEEALR